MSRIKQSDRSCESAYFVGLFLRTVPVLSGCEAIPPRWGGKDLSDSEEEQEQQDQAERLCRESPLSNRHEAKHTDNEGVAKPIRFASPQFSEALRSGSLLSTGPWNKSVCVGQRITCPFFWTGP